MPEPARSPFSYAILRVVPRVERGERFNAGVVLFCRQRGFLGAEVALDEKRLAALAPGTQRERRPRIPRGARKHCSRGPASGRYRRAAALREIRVAGGAVEHDHPAL